MGVGGDDGVPVAGAESSKAGLGLEGLPMPNSNSHPHSNRRPSAGDNGLPPMGVTPSDAPPSTVSLCCHTSREVKLMKRLQRALDQIKNHLVHHHLNRIQNTIARQSNTFIQLSICHMALSPLLVLDLL